jgi:hypothetical protein
MLKHDHPAFLRNVKTLSHKRFILEFYSSLSNSDDVTKMCDERRMTSRDVTVLHNEGFYLKTCYREVLQNVNSNGLRTDINRTRSDLYDS